MSTVYLTWRQSGGTHYGERNGATLVRLYEVNYGITDPEFPVLFIANWDAPTPSGWWGEKREQYEWRGKRVVGRTVAQRDHSRDRMLAEAKAAQERTFARWAGLLGLLPIEYVGTSQARIVSPGDTVTITGTVEV